jgi:hypothetical protein
MKFHSARADHMDSAMLTLTAYAPFPLYFPRPLVGA